MQRNDSIDILRFIALSGITLVHISPAPFWVQLRNFDVPLMVLLSGVSYSMSSGKELRYGSYCWKRFKRLVLPVWFFLLVYFLAYSIYTQHLPPLHQVVSYYTLMTGWYVWIIRVFFIIALIAPPIYIILRHADNNCLLLIIALLLILFEWYMSTPYSDFRGSVYLLMNIPYALIFALGCRLPSMSNRKVILMAVCCLLIYISLAYYYSMDSGVYVLTQAKKYPPQLYYTSYALACCFLLWLFRLKITNMLPAKVREFCLYIGSHTMWIYLWHIPLVSVVKGIDNAIARYLLVYGLALLITYVQTIFVNQVISRLKSESINRFMQTVFVR